MDRCTAKGYAWGSLGALLLGGLTYLGVRNKTEWTAMKRVGVTLGMIGTGALLGGFTGYYSCESKKLSPSYRGLPVVGGVGRVPRGLKCPEVKGISKSMWKRGMRVELEHTSNPAIARCIAATHFEEDRLYYDKLAKMERK